MTSTADLVCIRYRDHVLFRNVDPNLYRPVIREAVGWIIKENDEAVWILWNRSTEKLPHERIQPRESGLVILKSDILELRRLGAQRICTSSHKTRGVEYALQKSEAKNSAAVKGKGNANR